MAEVVEVVARLDDTIVAVAYGASVTVGETGDVLAPAPNVTFDADTVTDHTRTAGLLTIDVRRVSATTERIPRERRERRPAAYIGISMLVHLALWGTSTRAYPHEDGIPIHVGIARAVPVHIGTRGVAEPPMYLGPESPKPMMMWGNGLGSITDFVGHTSIDTVERPSSVDGRAPSASTASPPREWTREMAIEAARNAGILGADSLRGERELGDIPGTGEIASGFDGRAIAGAARGEDSKDAFATDRRLVGGYTGEGWDTISTGHYATLCGGPQADEPCRHGTNGYGRGVGEGHKARLPFPSVHINRASTAGDLSKELIRRYIRRKLPAIQACYEKALLVADTMRGVIETDFLIDSTGHARDVRASGMDPGVASCVATVLGTIQFPMSDGGGSTQVHYPFSFIVAGS